MTVASDSCLQNPIIIQKILKRLSPKPMENLKLRLIDKSFNSEILHRIRTAHRSIRMEFPKTDNFYQSLTISEQVVINNIYVNKHGVKTGRIFAYLEFLTKVANVKVEHFVMKNFWASVFGEGCRKRLHDQIHELLESQPLKTFIGMSDLCDGFCNKCYHLASTSTQYGPLQMGISLDSFDNKRDFHFEKLIVGERFLHGTASNISMYLPAEDPKKFIDYYVDPLISCDQLCFKINEYFWVSEQRLPTRPLPLEVIEKMCDVWKADSILIEYEFWPQRAETWSDQGIITPFRFDELYQETDRGSDKKKKKFSSVTVDLTNTREIYGEVIDGSIDQNHSYSNLIANVRRVFPTDKIIIISQQYPFYANVLTFEKERFENILKSVWKNPGHLEVTIRHHAIFVVPCLDFVILDSIDILGRRLDCTLLPGTITVPKGLIGRTYRITDRIGEKILNLEVFFGTQWLELAAKKNAAWLKFLEKLWRSQSTKEIENGFLKHFY